MSGKELTMGVREMARPRPLRQAERAPSRTGHRSRPGSRPGFRPGPQAGFTLIELMIVVIVIGILAAIAIPNFITMQNRAREGAVKANMHTIQMAVEDFGLLNDGLYPTSAMATVPDGRTLAQVCPTASFPKNPYTKLPTVVKWNANPSTGNNGEIALNPAISTTYVVKANGSDGDTLTLTLTSGQ